MLSKSITKSISVGERRRSRTEITAEILRIAKGGARKTRIVYGANINFKLLEDYLTRLEKAGLITRENGRTGVIRTTEKGIEYLHRYENLESLGIL